MFKKIFNRKIYLILILFFLSVSGVFATDLLEKAFDPAMEQQWLINLWNSSDAVGNEILRESMNVTIWQWVSYKAPLIVRISKFLLRMTIVLSVTMVLYNWIMYILKSSKWEDPKDVQKNLIYVWWWILLALSSLGIINLINSISTSSLKTGEDFWIIEINYKIWFWSYINNINRYFYKNIDSNV